MFTKEREALSTFKWMIRSNIFLMFNSRILESDHLGLKSHLYHFLAVWSCGCTTGDDTSPGFHSLRAPLENRRITRWMAERIHPPADGSRKSSRHFLCCLPSLGGGDQKSHILQNEKKNKPKNLPKQMVYLKKHGQMFVARLVDCQLDVYFPVVIKIDPKAMVCNLCFPDS